MRSAREFMARQLWRDNGEVGGDDEHAPGLTQVEVRAGGFVTGIHLFVYYHDETGAESFRFCTDCLFCGRNKWRNKHTVIGDGFPPQSSAYAPALVV